MDFLFLPLISFSEILKLQCAEEYFVQGWTPTNNQYTKGSDTHLDIAPTPLPAYTQCYHHQHPSTQLVPSYKTETDPIKQ